MNEDAAPWAAALIILVWLWCLAAFVPAFFVGRSKVLFRIVHISGIAAMAAFVVFWLSLLEGDSDVHGFIVAPMTVLALALWALRRFALTSLVLWAASLFLVVADYGFMAFFGPLPLAVVSGAAALSAKREVAADA